MVSIFLKKTESMRCFGILVERFYYTWRIAVLIVQRCSGGFVSRRFQVGIRAIGCVADSPSDSFSDNPIKDRQDNSRHTALVWNPFAPTQHHTAPDRGGSVDLRWFKPHKAENSV